MTPPLTAVAGFFSAGHDFDTVAVAQREVYGYDEVGIPELYPWSFAVFPGFACEFSGRETRQEAAYRVRHMLTVASLRRAPSPLLKLAYDNDVRRSATRGSGRHLLPYSVLVRQVRALAGAPKAHVTVENHAGRVWWVTWDGAFVVDDGVGRRMDLAAVLDFFRHAVFGAAARMV